MKYIYIIIFFVLVLPLSSRVAAQDSINPYNIQQSCNILLQNTDVYYNPFDPPALTDTRAELCNESGMLLDSDGIYPHWPPYMPKTHGGFLENWAPHGVTLGPSVVWQRLFQAKRDASGNAHDIVAGGGAPGTRVTISANEDVDFRASGRIKLKSGFHVKPGAFFHAYTEPKWDTAVFSDEFDDTAKFHNQWHISNGWGGNAYGQGSNGQSDTNVRLVTDPDAHDGYALDLIIREDTVDTCICAVLSDSTLDHCGNVLDLTDSTPLKFVFSSGMIRSCPFPYTQRNTAPLVSAYAHAPYGKYEIREKIPHVMHHTNNWGLGASYGFEYDINETDFSGNMDSINPDFNHKLRRGPYKGVFGTLGGTVVFISSQAHWCLSNKPESLIINNVPYSVQFVPGHGMDTVEAVPSSATYYSGWPTSLTTISPPDSFSFYYSIVDACIADNLTWIVRQDDSGKWRKFYAAYHDSSGHLLLFSKTNQPVSLTLHNIDAFGDSGTFNCHWEYNYNHPIDSGILYLDDTMSPSDFHSNTEAYEFTATDLYSDPGYPVPQVPFNGSDSTTSSYQYHTFAMEFLPHEVRFLVDSVVVRRLPDRLIPLGSPYYDWITSLPRALTDIYPSEIDIDNTKGDPFGSDEDTVNYGDGLIHYKSLTAQERHYFEHAASVSGWPGIETVGGKPVAHHMIDYIKVFDVPKDVKIPDYPH